MPRISFVDGFTGQFLARGIDCPQGSGTVACYPLFDGVTAMLLHLEAPGFWESREKRDALEINFCANGRFECAFSPRDHVTLTPGDMSLSIFDGAHGAWAESRFPLGYYEGVSFDVDCPAASRWMAANVPALATDFSALKENILGARWCAAESAGPRCEHVFREFYENLPYFSRDYLRLKALELFMLLRNIPRFGREPDYCSPQTAGTGAPSAGSPPQRPNRPGLPARPGPGTRSLRVPSAKALPPDLRRAHLSLCQRIPAGAGRGGACQNPPPRHRNRPGRRLRQRQQVHRSLQKTLRPDPQRLPRRRNPGIGLE